MQNVQCLIDTDYLSILTHEAKQKCIKTIKLFYNKWIKRSQV